MNLVAIANACAVECERQQVGLTELSWLIEAYSNLHFYVNHAQNPILSLDHFLSLGKTVEMLNSRGFRNTPVTFGNGGSSAPASEIPRLMEQLVENIHAFVADPPAKVAPHSSAVSHEDLARALTKEFLWVHPFVDGNGRLGFLLYNYLMGTLDQPLALPDFAW